MQTLFYSVKPVVSIQLFRLYFLSDKHFKSFYLLVWGFFVSRIFSAIFKARDVENLLLYVEKNKEQKTFAILH